MLSILSLILILIENSVSSNGVILLTTLPFISYVVRKGGNIFYLILTYILMSLQTDSYLYIFLVILVYILLNEVLLSYIEYNKKTVFYILGVQIIFYNILSYKYFDVSYLILNICGFIFWNYIYTKNVEIKGK
ncbi:MAG: hypothetical protein SOY60_09900 [Fusobacterium gastrosuis]|uniref:hypothetical protein n=1 Tax=Fusobacterium TaxID=848 RepID=UPI001F4FD33D|nr:MULTISPECIES: hypothetical protein [Fusobacterium]MDD7410747.1 hypothetical protein [Fusobacteriaceae bacterium]MCI7224009.1 hypothetical protein [Fusobacterium sp.]MDY4011965.1 hypothetical protein [Fusobacterium gastrosuis]MDY5305237.1 hypothetical protein [Fusobacterium gastrosuis]MDY5713100.1 hypothetical protein [Fusobacterium gastrosuis]